LNLYLLIAIVSVSVIFLLSLISLIAAKCYGTDSSFSRSGAPVITTHPDGSWSYSKSTQQYDVCFSSDTLKSDVVVFPSPFPPADAELISINEGDTFNRTQTLPSSTKNFGFKWTHEVGVDRDIEQSHSDSTFISMCLFSGKARKTPFFNRAQEDVCTVLISSLTALWLCAGFDFYILLVYPR
ncbi:protocadherin alpha-3-like, partial [Tachysurus ichikawai]